eukprot:159966_1
MLISQENEHIDSLRPEQMLNDQHCVYRFNDIKDILFIIPFKIPRNTLNLYVQFRGNYDFVFVKSFNIINSGNVENDTSKVDYILKTLKLLKHPINDPTDFFRKIGCHIKDTDISLIETNHTLYEPTLYAPSKIVLERVVEELQLRQLSKQYAVNTTKLKLVIYTAFCSFHPYIDIDQKEEQQLQYFQETEYKMLETSYNSNDEPDKKTQIVFKYGDSIIIKDDDLATKSYSIYYRNPKLFIKNRYFALQHIDKEVFKNCKNDYGFASCLKCESDKLILLDSNLWNDTYNMEVLNSKFVLIVDGNTEQQIHPDEVYGNKYVYQFNKIQRIHFIIPFRKRLYSVRVYVQLRRECNFVFVKSFDITNQITKDKKKTQIDYLLQMLKIYPF